MTTKQAFEHLIIKKKWYEAAGISEASAWTMVSRFKKGAELSLDKIEAVLLAAGYKVVQEKLWENYVSGIEKLVDMRDEHYGCQEWMDLHAHMFNPETSFIEKIKAYDIYLQKLSDSKGQKSVIDKLLESRDLAKG